MFQEVIECLSFDLSGSSGAPKVVSVHLSCLQCHAIENNQLSTETMDEFKMLGIEDLGKYLVQEGISSKTIEKLASEMISGRSLTLLDEAELKEVIPIIGDRAVVRNILKSLHDSETNKVL